jgi:hypothetical protein
VPSLPTGLSGSPGVRVWPMLALDDTYELFTRFLLSTQVTAISSGYWLISADA